MNRKTIGYNREAEGIRSFFLQNDFTPITVESYSLFKAYEADDLLQDRSAALITSWSSASGGLYKVIDGYLCGVFFFTGKPVYFSVFPPAPEAGGPLQHIIDILFELSRNAGLPFLRVGGIEESQRRAYENIRGYQREFLYSDKNSEYAIKTEDMLNLNGGINLNKRKRIKKCIKQLDLSYYPIDQENILCCLDIEDQWCSGKDCEYCSSFQGCEREALELMLKNYDSLIHKGILLYKKDIPIGYCLGETRNKTVAFAYFGKSVNSNQLAYIIYIMAELFFAGVHYINLADDMGNGGLRTFKTHLGIYEQWRNYSCLLRKET
jgi:hypothetical protein